MRLQSSRRSPFATTRTTRDDQDRAGRYMVRIAILLWCTGVGTCIWFMIKTHHTTTTTSQMSMTTISDTTTSASASLRLSDKQQQPQDVMKERLKHQSTVRHTQNWMQRTFLDPSQINNKNNNNKVKPPSSSQATAGSGGGGILPSWLTNGRQDVSARQQQQSRPKNEFNPMTGEGRESSTYTSINLDRPECNGLDPSFLRPTHGCELNSDTYTIHCHLQNFRVDVNHVHVKAKGGEEIQDVMGQLESDEFPTYTKGAFRTQFKPQKPIFTSDNDRRGLHYLEPLLSALEYPTRKQPNIDMSCVETWPGTTLFVTRYEYANLYHTMTDWWNAYFSSHHHKVLEDPIQVVFLDAHAKGNLDSTWHQLFGKVRYIRELPFGGVCFDNAVLIPPGYSSALFPQAYKPSCPIPQMANEFVQFILQSYGLEHIHRIPGTIVVIDRKPYVAHPRSHPENTQRLLDNMNVLVQRLETEVKGVKHIELVQLETLSFGEQVSKMRQAHIVIGYHGAGLTHVLFMDDKSHMIEFTSGYLDFFSILVEWRPGVEHTMLSLSSSDTTTSTGRLSSSDMERVVSQVKSILQLS